jgi:hypothetical protein
LASLGTQLATWTTIGLLFGGLTQRSLKAKKSAVRSGASAQPS